ncbi:MAG: sigma-70 family RNA polymerase sigma factor [Anaerolineae bacterium]|nr:sigma-70 family RNA polymerase sigma factor [Thermoflexales bacterium]MDW8054445.1 sigma-70 family RNA polymerase sigma factor [Anaerolineae bacterium]
MHNAHFETQTREQEMVARLKAGDPEACTWCVETHTPALYRLALRIVNDPAEAEDVVQDTFLSAFRHIQQFDGRSSLGTWLYRIAYNAALMRLRKRHEAIPLGVHEHSEDGDNNDLIPDERETPDEAVLRREAVEQLGEALLALPPSLRSVFFLREVEDLSTAETARRLQISEGAVKVRLHRARQALRRHLQAQREQRPQPIASLACTEALHFIEAAERRGEHVDPSLKATLREYIALCEDCRVALNPRYETVLFYCDDRPSDSLSPEARHTLFVRLQQLWGEQKEKR